MMLVTAQLIYISIYIHIYIYCTCGFRSWVVLATNTPKSASVSNWAILHGVLRGSCPEDPQLPVFRHVNKETIQWLPDFMKQKLYRTVFDSTFIKLTGKADLLEQKMYQCKRKKKRSVNVPHFYETWFRWTQRLQISANQLTHKVAKAYNRHR